MPEQQRNDGGGSGGPVATGAGGEGQPLVANQGDQAAQAVSMGGFVFSRKFSIQ